MNAQQGFTAPESGSTDVPTFEELAADPEIAALLDFEPAPRKVERPDGWTPDLQRELIARIVDIGSPGHACDAMDKNLSGAKHLYRTDGADSFRAAWKAAIDLAAERKRAERAATVRHPAEVPGIARPTRKSQLQDGPLPGQRMNEFGEWEDEESFLRRADEARDSVRNKLVRARRWYLAEISSCPGKRAAFEILTELPIDWAKAERGEPQEFEPLLRTNQRQPDMILTAENGWSMGEIGYGRDRREEMQRTLNEWRAEEGLPPIEEEGW